MKQKCTAREDVNRAKRQLKMKEAALKNEIAKERHGMDLVFIFYSLMSVVLFIATLQIVAYHIGTYQENSFLYKILNDVFVFIGFDTQDSSFAYQFFGIPLNVLLDFLVLYTLGYGGFEGSTAFIKTLSLDNGQFAQMPEKKLRRFFRFILVWYFSAIVLSVYQMVILPIDVKLSFYIDKVFTGLGISSIVYMYGRKAPKSVADITIKKSEQSDPVPEDNIPPMKVTPPAPIQIVEDHIATVHPKNPVAGLFPGGN